MSAAEKSLVEARAAYERALSKYQMRATLLAQAVESALSIAKDQPDVMKPGLVLVLEMHVAAFRRAEAGEP